MLTSLKMHTCSEPIQVGEQAWWQIQAQVAIKSKQQVCDRVYYLITAKVWAVLATRVSTQTHILARRQLAATHALGRYI